MTRRMFEDHLDRVVKTIVQRYKSEKIILFGSAATGKIHEDSDADLAVIKKTKKKLYDRIGEVARKLTWARVVV